MVSRAHHRRHTELFAQGAIGIIGPGVLRGCLESHRAENGSVMVAEGEVYRAGAWRADAAGEGHPWALVHDLWIRGGGDALSRVDGLYSLARYDDSPGDPALVLLSDRYGSRRLFIHDDGEVFAFAADFQALVAWVGDAVSIDRAFVEETVCLGAPLRGATWVTQIQLFPPATEMRVSLGATREGRYWDWTSLPAPGSNRQRDLVAETYERWREVLDLRLTGGRLGQQLSGGLDSRLILAEVARRRSGWASVTYGEPAADEVRFAKRAARAVGSTWTLLELPGPDWLDHRVAASLENGGFVDLINAHHAGRLETMRGLFDVEMSGFTGDVTLGDTYWGLNDQGVMDRLPYWSSPVSLPPEEAFARISADIGGRSTWGFMMDTKLRRAINWWPHMCVNDLEVRKPFLDYGFLEFCAGLPLELRRSSRMHVEILRRFFPALARVPIQRTGVRPGAPRLAYLAMAGVRRLHRGARAAGIPLRPWVRGAFDLSTWLQAPGIEQRFRDVLVRPDARVAGYFDRASVAAVLDQTFGIPQVAHEIAFHLYRVEQVLAEIPVWARAGRD